MLWSAFDVINFTRSSEPVLIASGESRLAGVLELPSRPRGAVLFTHGRDSGRRSAPNSYLAAELRRVGLATLLLDLTNPAVDTDADDAAIALSSEQLGSAADWLAAEPETKRLPLGVFGAGRETAAALRLASIRPGRITAIVSRGGRPDLAGIEVLRRLRVPTLLIVGEDDRAAIELNREALDQLSCEKDLAVIRGASRLCEEPGTLQEVARLSARWFRGYLSDTAHGVAAPGARPS